MGLADIFGFGAPAQMSPDPQVSMAQLLAGGQVQPIAATPAPVATAYGDSPAPGAVAQAAGQANAAAANEPGVMDRVQGWVRQNPVQAQALMQGFGALAAGHTRGNWLAQLGQASGVANQTMVEGNAAQDELKRKQQQVDFEQQNKTADNQRADRQLSNSERNTTANINLSQEQIEASRQRRKEGDAMLNPKIDALRAKVDQARQAVASAKTEDELRRAQINMKKVELQVYKEYGPKEAEAALAVKTQQRANLEEVGAGQMIENDMNLSKYNTYNSLPLEDRQDIASGIKPDRPAKRLSPAEYAKSLLKDNPDTYRDPKTGAINMDLLMRDAKTMLDIENYDPNKTKQEWEAARNSVKPGQRYKGPDGQTYIRK